MKGGYTTVNEILTFFKKIYCSTIGVEYMHISDPVEKKWFRERLEKVRINYDLPIMEKKLS